MISAPTRVLLAEDDERLAEIVAHILTEAGHHVEIARDGATARTALRDRYFDVVLSDINMPRMSGVELLRSLREDGADTAVVLITADPRVETAALAVERRVELSREADRHGLAARGDRTRMHCRTRGPASRRGAAGRGGASARADRSRGFSLARDGLDVPGLPAHRRRPRREHVRTRAALADDRRNVRGSLRVPRRRGGDGRGRDARAADPADGRQLAIACVAGDVFVDIHPLELSDPDLSDPTAPLSCLASRVVLEITERAAVGQGAEVREQIDALRRLGFRIAVDDLGAGYAGLSSVANLEPEFVKIDMSIVRGVDSSPMKRRLIGALGPACRGASIRVVAEGIETEGELDAVRELGCDLVQGFLLGRPASPAPLPTWRPRPPVPTT